MSWSETVALNKSKNKLRKVILSYTGEKYNETKLPNQLFFLTVICFIMIAAESQVC